MSTFDLRRRRSTTAAALTGLVAAPLAILATTSPAQAAPVTIQILATNDFHGRLLANGSEAGAAQFAGAIEQYRTQDPTGTVFAAAGDLVGASTFESFIQHDKPTIDAMNAMGLQVSAAGNHEFDQGYNDLANRIMKPYDATTNPYGGAEWQYLAANVRKRSDNSYALPDVAASPGVSNGATWMTTVEGVDVGFVGAVTEDLPSLVTPGGIADVKVTSIVDEVRAGAQALRTAGADVVVMLVHEGATSTSCPTVVDPATAFGKIVSGVGTTVNAIVSGHTHLAYDCQTSQGVPVVSAGQYGTNFNMLQFTVDTAVPSVQLTGHEIVAAGKVQLTAQSAKDKAAQVKAIVDDAVAKSNVLGAVELGKLGGGFYRARLANGTTENRGGESTLGNLVAEVQRWATRAPESGAAQIAFMNPGGLRDDMVGNNAAGYPATLTYKQAAVVQPFANTLVNMRLTGSQIKKVLEEQWQRDNSNNVPSRPFLRLGTSKGFFATYDATRPEGDRVTGMWLNGTPIALATAYSVTVNSFLASGGDNFRTFNQGTAKRDTGKVDLQAMVDYMAATAKTTPLPVDYQQHQVGATWPADKPAFYRVGQKVRVKLSSLAMTAPRDLRDRNLDVRTQDAKLWHQWVDNAISTEPYDESGRSDVVVRLKGGTRPGKQMLIFTGATTKSTFGLPIEIRKAVPDLKIFSWPDRVVAGETRAHVKVKMKAKGLDKVYGKVKVVAGGHTYKAKLKKSKVVLELAEFKNPGLKKIRVSYLGSKVVRGDQKVLRVLVRVR